MWVRVTVRAVSDQELWSAKEVIHVITIRIRSLLWFGTAVLVALALLGGSLAFRAGAAPGPAWWTMARFLWVWWSR